MLILLLEILSGDRLPKPTKGKMRIHCLENVDKALQFLLHEQRVHLENLGSHDIVDGNNRLTLGLIWTIILRFQIQDITIEEVDNQETKSAKDALLLWCQMKTAGYPNVNVRNFTTSWKDGLAFNAIIHKHRPELIAFDKLNKSNAIPNLNNAFTVADRELGLAPLLEAEDVFTDNPDEKSIITYVVTYYHYFSKMKAETVQGRRIAKAVGFEMENDRMIDEYEKLTSDLLKWIEKTIETLGERQFANSLMGVQQQLSQFNGYRTIEKPPKFMEKGNLEILLHTLQSRMRGNNQKPYMPREGKMVADVNRAWERLERAEHERELALREELIRQEKLEQLAARFDRKAGMRETWLSENQRLVSQDNFGFDLPAVEAAAKKHEAIETDIFAYEERVEAVISVAKELETENYHDIDRINERKNNVLRLWNYLLELLKNRRTRLEQSADVQQSFQEMSYILDSMDGLRQRLISDDYGKHLMGVEDLLQKHSLLEADINVLGERVRNVVQNVSRYRDESAPDGYRPSDPRVIQERVHQLEESYSELVGLAIDRRNRLEESRKLHQFYWDIAEEEAWIREKEQILSSEEIGHDLTAVNLLISKNKALEDELAAHETQLLDDLRIGEDLIQAGHYAAPHIQQRVDDVNASWDRLKELQAMRTMRLTQATDYHQFFTDADDVDVWMLDNMRLVSSDDVGIDESTALILLKKHNEVQEDLKNYANAIDLLKVQADSLNEEDRKSPEVRKRLADIEDRYQQLINLSQDRRQRLHDAIARYNLFSEADSVEQWISEKEKMVGQMTPGREMEDIEVLKHRFDTFDKEMGPNAARVAGVNELAQKLLNSQHPDSRDIQARRNQLNDRWNRLSNAADKKRDDIDAAHGVQQYHIEMRETVTWIDEKIKLLQETEELGTDLGGVMTLQRKLKGMDRDLAAIESKLASLQSESAKMENEHPEERDIIEAKTRQIRDSWSELTKLLKAKDAKLEEAGDLHRFLRDLDHFQAWLTKTQTDVASEDIPSSLAEAEKLLSQHQQIKDEITNYTDDYNSMMEYGAKVTQGQTDPQYMFLRERLKALQDGWDELHKMWANRQILLSHNMNEQMFLRDAKQAEVLLNQQEHYLSKDETPATLEEAENLIKRHEAFLTKMEANDEKINNVIAFGQRFAEQVPKDGAKIRKKADSIAERRSANIAKANAYSDKLNDQQQMQQFLSDCDELGQWVQEKAITAQDETYRSAKTVHSKWTRHQAFEAEIAANKDRLDRLMQHGNDLIDAKPERRAAIEPRLQDLGGQFKNLEDVTKEKGEKLFDANRHALYEQTCDDIDEWIQAVETRVLTAEPGQDLTSVNHILQKQQNIEDEMQQKARQVDALQNQADYLEKIEPEKKDDIQRKKRSVEERFQQLQNPLSERKEQLLKKKEAFQFRRDVADEKLWIQEKLPMATSTERGNSLYGVQGMRKKHQSLRTEIDNHEPRINNVVGNGKKLISERHEDSPEFERLIKELLSEWEDLKKKMDQRKALLQESERAQQFYYDASEAEAWMSEQELYMMVDDRGKDEVGAHNMMKKHESLENAVEDYANTVKELSDAAKRLIDEGHPDADNIAIRQAQIDKLYAGLKDLAAERRGRLDQGIQLFALIREFDDAMQWISEREVAAGSAEMGQDYEHVNLLIDRFRGYTKETEATGNERIANFNESADILISSNHVDAATIAELKDSLNDAYADLMEMIDTRIQMLQASLRLHKFFYDCKEVYSRILEKQNEMSEELGRDSQSVSSLLRKHASYEHDLQALKAAVGQIETESAELQAAYAGEKAKDIVNRTAEVVAALKKLLAYIDARKNKLQDTGDLFTFMNLVRDLMLWMDLMMRQMDTKEKPRDVSGVELLMNNHQSLKAEIDARQDNIMSTVQLGKELLARNHYASADILDKLNALADQNDLMNNRWDDRWEHLQLILEVYQFARDATVAESWLAAQEPYLQSTDLGVCVVQPVLMLHSECIICFCFVVAHC
jgi:spectrin beta